MVFVVVANVSRAASVGDSPEKIVRQAIEKMNQIVLSESGQNTARVKELDQKAEALSALIIPEKEAALTPLGQAAEDVNLPIKARIFAVNFLGLLNDPGSFQPLKKILLDSHSPDVLRSQAASVLFSVPVSIPARRRVFCRALAQKDIPPFALSQVLFEVSRLGCRDVNLIEDRAKSFGRHPRQEKKILALLAIDGLGESYSLDAGGSLWSLFNFYPAGSSERGEILKSLLKRSFLDIPDDSENVIHAKEALRLESEFPRNAILALNLVTRLGGLGAKATLKRELENPDPAVRAAAAKALAGLTSSDNGQ